MHTTRWVAGVIACGFVYVSAAYADEDVPMAVPLIDDVESGEFDPAWSSDGMKLAFDSTRGSFFDTWIYDMVTGDVTQLTDGPGFDGWPCWSPDDSKIVFQSDRDGTFQLYTVPATGGTATPLGIEGADPEWSPIGGWIAYSDGRDIWKVPETGGTPVQLTDDPQGDRNPYYSPDGSQIVYRHQEGPDYNLWTVPADGGEAMPLLQGPGFRGDPAWSPDGEWILYSKYHPPVTGERGQLYVYNIAGDFETPITFPPELRQDFYNDWWQDDDTGLNRIAFESDRAGATTDEQWDIWIVEFMDVVGTPEILNVVVVPDVRVRQNVPNPFNPKTTFEIDLERPIEDAQLVVYDASGRRVRTFGLGPASPGALRVTWDGTDDRARDLPSGVYLYRVEHRGGHGDVRKATLVR